MLDRAWIFEIELISFLRFFSPASNVQEGCCQKGGHAQAEGGEGESGRAQDESGTQSESGTESREKGRCEKSGQEGRCRAQKVKKSQATEEENRVAEVPCLCLFSL
jgi:hypothetical protein